MPEENRRREDKRRLDSETVRIALKKEFLDRLSMVLCLHRVFDLHCICNGHECDPACQVLMKSASQNAQSKAKRANVIEAKRSGKAPKKAAEAAKAGKKAAATKAKAAPKKKIKVALKGKKESNDAAAKAKAAKAKKAKAKKAKAKKAKATEKENPADKGELDLEIDSYFESKKK